MSFFSSFEEMPEPERPERPAHQPWFGPTPGVIPGAVAGTWPVFESAQAVLAISHLNAYTDGVHFTLNLWVRGELGEELWDAPFEPMHPMHRGSNQQSEDQLLRFGFRFGDGTAWANTHPGQPWSPDEPPTAPICISQGGGGGGGDHWSFEYWLWPLPPAGETRVFASWPIHDIAETSIALDTDQIREAARQARRLWPDS